MYTAFLLMAVGQAFLISNWVGGLAGLVGFSALFFPRVGKEERLMLDTFGEDYALYMGRTRRLVPWFLLIAPSGGYRAMRGRHLALTPSRRARL